MLHSKKVLQKSLAFGLSLLLLASTVPTGFLKVGASTALPVAIKLNGGFTPGIIGGAGANTLLQSQSGSANETSRGLPAVNGTQLQLTDCGTSESGTVVRRNRMSLNGGFSTFFQIDMNGGNKADGISFVVYKANPNNNLLSIGSFGSGLGYEGIPDSVAVEFDTYCNNGSTDGGAIATVDGSSVVLDAYNPNDPGNPHVAIDSDGSVCHTGTASSTSTDSNNPTIDSSNMAHVYSNMYSAYSSCPTNVWVDYSADGYITVTYGPNTTRTSSSNYSFKRNVGTTLLNEDVYVGFAASTGGNYENHYVNQWDFQNSYVSGGGLDPNADYVAEASSAKISFDSSSNPSSATVQLYDPTGGRITYSDSVKIYIDNTYTTTASTDATGALNYAIPAQSPGTHTIKMATSDGSAVNTASFTVTVPSFTVSYSAGANGTLSGGSSESVSQGSKPAHVPTPVANSGYHFTAWTPGDPLNTIINAATTFTAGFAANNYSLRFFDDSGNSLSATYADQNVVYNTTVGSNLAGGLLPVPSKNGYKFNGWSTSPGNTGSIFSEAQTYTAAQDTALYEDWTANTYAMNFDAKDGTAQTVKTVTYNAAVGTLPVPSKSGYSFLGWFTGEDGTGTQYTASSTYLETNPITLYASWTPDTYALHFDTQGGGTESDVNVTYNTAVGTLPEPTRDGYKFIGWFTGANGAGTQYTSSMVYTQASGITLYADWVKIAEAPAITANTATTGNVGDSATFTANAVVSDGGVLTYQWQVSNDGGKTFTSVSGATDSSYTIARLTGEEGGTQYRCIVTNSINGTATQMTTAPETLKLNTLVVSVINKIDSLPDPASATDQQIVNNENNIVTTKQAYDKLDANGKSAVGTPRADKLNQLIYRLNALLVVEPKDKSTGIEADNLGTSVQLPELLDPSVGKVLLKLLVAPVADTATKPANIALATTTLGESGRSILKAYDVSLFKSIFDASGAQLSAGKVSNSNIVGAINVRIPMPEGYAGRTDLQVVYIDDSGNITPLSTSIVTVDGVQYIQFTTTHFSEYAITIGSQVSNPKTGGQQEGLLRTFLPLCLPIFVASQACIVAVRRKKKKISF